MLNPMRLKRAARLARAVACDAEYDEDSVRRLLHQFDEDFRQALADCELADAAQPELLNNFGRI